MHRNLFRLLARTCLILVFIAALVFIPVSSVIATAPDPRHAAHPPIAPEITHPQDETQSLIAWVSPQALPTLKAVLIVGPIDGDTGSWTTGEIANMELAAAALTAHGVTVSKFYTPNNNWDQIKAAANGAHFLLYRGHGVYWPPPDMPTPAVGGFALKDKMISNDMIRTELNLAPNAIIMLYGCFTAGSAGNDTSSISVNEAVRRVAMYSDPFFDIGAGGYFADWFGEAFPSYINSLFAGKTQRQAYEAFWDFNDATDSIFTHPDHPEMQLRLDKDDWYDPKPQYNNAFVGKSDATLTDLFVQPEMRLSTEALTVLITPQMTQQNAAIQINVDSPINTWKASLETKPSWLSLTHASGAGGDALLLHLTPTQIGNYTAQIIVTADDPTVVNRQQTLTVEMKVVEKIYQINLPVAIAN